MGISTADYEAMQQRLAAARKPRATPPHSVAPDAVSQPNPIHESMGETTRAVADPKKYRVRITSFRSRLVDERNLWDKYFVDALKYAGILHDDSPKWCKVEVRQAQVDKNRERTIIEIEEME